MGRVTTLTRKGQVTIPKEVRDALGLKPHDKIAFTVENGHATLRRAYLSLDEIAGSIPPLGRTISDAEMSEIVRDEVARRYAEKFLK